MCLMIWNTVSRAFLDAFPPLFSHCWGNRDVGLSYQRLSVTSLFTNSEAMTLKCLTSCFTTDRSIETRGGRANCLLCNEIESIKHGNRGLQGSLVSIKRNRFWRAPQKNSEGLVNAKRHMRSWPVRMMKPFLSIYGHFSGRPGWFNGSAWCGDIIAS